jgi:hypothetical protein
VLIATSKKGHYPYESIVKYFARKLSVMPAATRGVSPNFSQIDSRSCTTKTGMQGYFIGCINSGMEPRKKRARD